jgi:hypothetical protein
MVVELTYRPATSTDGVYIRANIDYHPSVTDKHKYPNWDYQERSLRVYFDDAELPDLVVDFWIKFARSGDIVIRPGRFKVIDKKQDYQQYLKLNFVEDQLLTMIRSNFSLFAGNFPSNALNSTHEFPQA